MTAILSFLSSALFRVFGERAAYFVATKILMVTLMVTFLPVILKNLIVWFISTVFSFIQSQIGSYEISSQVLQFTGLTAWFADTLQLPLAIGIVLTAVSVRMVLNFVPMVK